MDAHVRIDLPARFINHSCDANCGVMDNEFGAYDFIARRTIVEGEELSFNYETSEYVISAFETCMCGAENCRGYVAGFGMRVRISVGYCVFLLRRKKLR